VGDCSNCSDTSGVAVGEEIAGDGEAVGELSLSEEGAGINESRELLAALGVGFGIGVESTSPSVGAELGFSGVVSK
jgi:hypothetical protein